MNFLTQIDNLGNKLGGYTNIEAGLNLGLQQFTHQDTGNVLLLLTDGNINKGIKGTTEMVEFMQKNNIYNVRNYTIGYGANHNSELLSTLANKSKLVIPLELLNLISPKEVTLTGERLMPKSIGPLPSKEQVFSFKIKEVLA